MTKWRLRTREETHMNGAMTQAESLYKQTLSRKLIKGFRRNISANVCQFNKEVQAANRYQEKLLTRALGSFKSYI
jgi:hypothetical protein